MKASRNAGSCPTKRLSAIKAFTVAIAPPFCESVGRMIEHAGRCGRRNAHGSGRIRFVWNIWLPAAWSALDRFAVLIGRVVEVREHQPGNRIR
jgi:hypothetical protein